MAGVAARFTDSHLPSWTVGLLGEARMRAADVVRARHLHRSVELAARARGGDRSASQAYGELAERALSEMRSEILVQARLRGFAEHLVATIHRHFGDTDAQEYLDDPNLDRDVRVQLMTHLDELNRLVGNYRAFFRALEPLLSRSRPTRVLDLAAGHAGFALEAARIAARKGVEIEITATDLLPEYLDVGRHIAARDGLPVRFAAQDALDLSNFGEGEYDVVMCTQSLHHFGSSMIARMFLEAMRVAGRGVVFIDGCRSLLHGALLPTATFVRYRNPAFTHDAWVSLRRFYTPEELGLVAGFGCDGVQSTWMRPAHCLVRWARETA